MWETEKTKNGYTVRNSKTGDSSWDTFEVSTEAEAQAECDRRNAAHAKIAEEMRSRSRRAQERKKSVQTPTEILGTGDDLKGSVWPD